MSAENVYDDAACLRRFAASLFRSGIRNLRQRSGLSIEQAAGRAGIEAGQWREIEAGEQPVTRVPLPLLARGLGVSQADLAPLVVFCRGLYAQSKGAGRSCRNSGRSYS